jgi:GTP-binding protein Era
VVALVGAPNVGKSTLFNALLGQKVAIAGPKPQTTRLVIRGILTRPGWQAILVDTPGLLEPSNLLEASMRRGAQEALKDADLVLYLASVDVPASWSAPGLGKAPALGLLTKADERQGREALWAALSSRFPRVLEVSARKKTGLKELEAALAGALPEGPALYGEDELTDQSLRQAAAEIIREKALLFTRQEVPHSLAVGIEEYREREDGIHAVTATLYVERESQKGILIGAQGAHLKKIGSAARAELEGMAGAKVFLKLWVKVAKDWKKDAAFLKRLGLSTGRVEWPEGR